MYQPEPYLPQQDIRSSSHNVNEFNEESQGLLFQSTPLHKCTAWLVHLCPLIFLLLVLIISSLLFILLHSSSTSQAKEANSVLHSYYRDLSAPPIRSILLQQASESRREQCPEGTDPESLLVYPSIKSGCLCPDGTLHSKAYCVTNEECTSVSSREAIPFLHFRKAKLCVGRYSKSEFQIKSEENCPTGFSRACGSLLCLKDSRVISGGVPVDVLTSINEAPADSLVDKSFDQSDPSRKKYKFELTCTSDAKDIIGIRAGFGDAPCSSNKKPGKLDKTYPPSTLQFDGCGDYSTKSYASKLATTTPLDLEEGARPFFTQNSFLIASGNPIVYSSRTDLPHFSDYVSETDKVDLYKVQRPPVGSDAACKKWSRKLFQGDNEGLTDILRVMEILTLINIVLSAVGIFLILFYLCGDYINCCKRYPFRGSWLYYVILFLCFVVACLCIAQAIYYWNYDSEDGVGAHVDGLMGKNCFDGVPNVKKAAGNVVEYHSNGSSELSAYVLFLFIWAVVWVVLWLGAWILRLCVLKDKVVVR